MGSITVASWRVVDAQEAMRIELATQRIMIPLFCKITGGNFIETSHFVSDRRGQRNAMNEEERAIARDRKSTSLEPEDALALQ